MPSAVIISVPDVIRRTSLRQKPPEIDLSAWAWEYIGQALCCTRAVLLARARCDLNEPHHLLEGAVDDSVVCSESYNNTLGLPTEGEKKQKKNKDSLPVTIRSRQQH